MILDSAVFARYTIKIQNEFFKDILEILKLVYISANASKFILNKKRLSVDLFKKMLKYSLTN